MYFNPLNKNPQSPWSKHTNGLTRGSRGLRWGTVFVLAFLALTTYGCVMVIRDAHYLKGPVTTTGHFDGITGQNTYWDRNGSHLQYTGAYSYSVDGQPYKLTLKDQDTNKFAPQATIIYKTDNPNDAEVLYDKTPARAIILDVIATVIIAVACYFLLYFIASFVSR